MNRLHVALRAARGVGPQRGRGARSLATESKSSKSIPPPPDMEDSPLAKFARYSFFAVGVGFIAYLTTVNPEDIKKAHQETREDMKVLERITEEVQRKTLDSNSSADGRKK